MYLLPWPRPRLIGALDRAVVDVVVMRDPHVARSGVGRRRAARRQLYKLPDEGGHRCLQAGTTPCKLYIVFLRRHARYGTSVRKLKAGRTLCLQSFNCSVFTVNKELLSPILYSNCRVNVFLAIVVVATLTLLGTRGAEVTEARQAAHQATALR